MLETAQATPKEHYHEVEAKTGGKVAKRTEGATMHLPREANSPSEGKPLQSTAYHLKRSSGFTRKFVIYDLNKGPGKKKIKKQADLWIWQLTFK